MTSTFDYMLRFYAPTRHSWHELVCNQDELLVVQDPALDLVKAIEKALQADKQPVRESSGGLIVYRSNGKSESIPISSLGFSPHSASDTSLSAKLLQVGDTPEQIAALLSRFELGAVADRPIANLSTLQKQQALLLAHLANNTELLLLHDPFSLFNGRWREQFAELFLERAAQRQAPILVVNSSFLPGAWAKQIRVLQIDDIQVTSPGITVPASEKHCEKVTACHKQEQSLTENLAVQRATWLMDSLRINALVDALRRMRLAGSLTGIALILLVAILTGVTTFMDARPGERSGSRFPLLSAGPPNNYAAGEAPNRASAHAAVQNLKPGIIIADQYPQSDKPAPTMLRTAGEGKQVERSTGAFWCDAHSTMPFLDEALFKSYEAASLIVE